MLVMMQRKRKLKLLARLPVGLPHMHVNANSPFVWQPVYNSLRFSAAW